MPQGPLHATFVPGDPGRGSRLALWSPEGPNGDSPSEQLPFVLPGIDGPVTRHIPVTLVSVRDLLDELMSLHLDDPKLSDSMHAWAVVTRSTLGLIARGRIRPAVSPGGFDTWAVGPLQESDHQVRRALARWLPPTAHCLALDDGGGPTVISPEQAIEGFQLAVADELPRTAAAGTVARVEGWCGPDRVDVRRLRAQFPAVDASERTVVGMRLSLPDDEDEPFRVRLQVRSAADTSIVADAEDLWAGRAAGFGHDAEADLLLALRRGSRLWPPLAELLDEARPSSLEVDDDAAMQLLGPLATDLRGAGIEVLVPSALTRTLGASAVAEPPPGTGDQPAVLDLASLCELAWRPTLDGEPVNDEELSALAESRRPLVRLRGRWVVVDPTVVEKLHRRQQVTVADALAAALSGSITLDGERTEVAVGGAIAGLADRLRAAGQPHEADEPAGLRATLRPYQRRGLAWLAEMVDLGLGGVLADDMGLGKTVQLIALHVQRAGGGHGPTLVICPATLVGNWEREIARFAPGVRTHRFHGTDRSLDGLDPDDILITTYGVMRRDVDLLADRVWGLVVADEAQQVKNPNSSTARAIRQIPAGARLALTGTPVENRLTELWALLDWTTPGLLGPVEHFRRSVAVPVERDLDPEATARFSRLITPFLLRRRKLDPEVAPDLPPKTETDHPVRLTEEQAALYRATVEEILEAIERSEGMARRGLVLKLLTALKQICNHPAQYLGQQGPLGARSGKLEALDDLIAAIGDAGDSTLVFTQYVRMGELLMSRFHETGTAAEFLHGSLSLQRRTDMVDRFQRGDFPVFVVSLKAGGTGLNLTRATHVVHYDRWWNPAVEAQASDRAWRIGQDRPVQVHRLISEGTVEDRIAEILERKRSLADSVVGAGEAWITELADDELADLVRLGRQT
jgi:superfamily II DNA or RNA helicase